MPTYLQKIATCCRVSIPRHLRDVISGVSVSRNSSSPSSTSTATTTTTCADCGAEFGNSKDLDEHFLSDHALTLLAKGDHAKGDISLEAIEKWCQETWLSSEITFSYAEHVFEIHNKQSTLDQFENYREMVKQSHLKHLSINLRQLVLHNGNELLRCYYTTFRCFLGTDGFSCPCTSKKCNLCRILRNGFSCVNEFKKGLGIRTIEIMGCPYANLLYQRQLVGVHNLALIVCEVIAGRESLEKNSFMEQGEYEIPKHYDSVRVVDSHRDMNYIDVFDTKALLPRFVVTAKERARYKPRPSDA